MVAFRVGPEDSTVLFLEQLGQTHNAETLVPIARVKGRRALKRLYRQAIRV